MQPLLIVKTPRAGEYNHRYLVTVKHGCSETEIYSIAQRATGRVCGPDFLAAYRQVSQLKGGRTGEEAIILAGIDTAALGERQKIILALLDDLLADLGHLVTEEIDWSQLASKRMLIPWEPLNLWMRRLKEQLAAECRGDASLPTYTPTAPIISHKDLQPASALARTIELLLKPYGLMASIGMVCLIVGGVVGWSLAGSGAAEKPMEDLPMPQHERRQSQLESVTTVLGDCAPCPESVSEPESPPPDCIFRQSDIDVLNDKIRTLESSLTSYRSDFVYLCNIKKLELSKHVDKLANSCVITR